MHEVRSDAELLRAVRDGDGGAYEVLWQRHFDAALRYAGHLYPSRAEDLVSESFLAIYQQVRTSRKGPDFAFRLYLRSVIRNTSIRWRRDAARVLDAEDLDVADPRDGLRHVERESDSAEVLAAFGALPDRWQRVLWLSEVDQARRPEIARALGIKPNAVSALQRRARAGMKHQWLLQQVPVSLRGDHAHVARLLPRHVAQPRNAALAAEVAAHLITCVLCEDLLVGMRSSVARAQGGALAAVLVGAAGAGLPITASLSGGTAAAAATTATGGAGVLAWIFGGGVSAATVGSLVLTALFTVAPPVAPLIDAQVSPMPALTAPPGPSAPAQAMRAVPAVDTPSASVDVPQDPGPGPALAPSPIPVPVTPPAAVAPSPPITELPITELPGAGVRVAGTVSAEVAPMTVAAACAVEFSSGTDEPAVTATAEPAAAADMSAAFDATATTDVATTSDATAPTATTAAVGVGIVVLPIGAGGGEFSASADAWSGLSLGLSVVLP
ncbi:sigma-70 family RNA polymerase sigma factor [Microbacterium sp. 22303]|uniref:RNA polymerase sigma factor n=1 Tax=Microbacterium sp. 22303 TaxID=3453905 RepID=UPI003F87E0FA